MNRCHYAALALLTISLLLVSCGSAPYECTDPLGCLEIISGDPIVIGSILVTAGKQRPVGNQSLESMEKAVSDQDNLLGHPIQLISIGTDCTGNSARSAATGLAANPSMVAIIGPTCAVEADVAGPILLDAGIPLLGPVTDSEVAYELTNQVFAAIEQVAVQLPDSSLFIPRQALLEALFLSP
jgi:ABC-type branched-subunit amino acid transport system substrate-binding protein